MSNNNDKQQMMTKPKKKGFVWVTRPSMAVVVKQAAFSIRNLIADWFCEWCYLLFNTGMEMATEEFCISCHEMRENVYEEYMMAYSLY